MLSDTTVVIPTIGRDLLEGCLQSIAAGSVWPARVLVVDQSNNSAVADCVARLADAGLCVEHLHSRDQGAAAARNRGFERVTTRYVAATDDDCRVAPDWLERMVAHLRENSPGFVTGRVENLVLDDPFMAPSLMESAEPEVHSRPLLRRDPLYANNMGFAVETAHRIGPMDERACVRYAEDAEWSYRALRAGVPVRYAPDVVVRHAAWRNASELALTYRRYVRCQGGFYGIYMRRGDRFIVARALFDLARGPWLVLRGLATRNSALTRIGRAYMRELGPGILDGLRVAGGEQTAR
jgi:GT2 family glycosyltransferase